MSLENARSQIQVLQIDSWESALTSLWYGTCPLPWWLLPQAGLAKGRYRLIAVQMNFECAGQLPEPDLPLLV
jgi:hypothetical protein